MLRYTFRALAVLTVFVMYLTRRSGGQMNPYEFVPFYYWFLASVFVFGAFGVWSVYKAVQDSRNRRAYLFDILIAVTWVPYWLSMVR